MERTLALPARKDVKRKESRKTGNARKERLKEIAQGINVNRINTGEKLVEQHCRSDSASAGPKARGPAALNVPRQQPAARNVSVQPP